MNHLSNQIWTGEFYAPDGRDNRFAGEINYSPEEGLHLSYRIVGPENIAANTCLHGVTQAGDRCTLIGPFFEIQSQTRRGGSLSTRGGKVAFSVLVIGDAIAEDEKYTDASFSLTNIEEFFFPTGYKDSVRLADRPICSSATSFGEVTVSHSAVLSNLHDIRAAIYCNESNASEALEKAFEAVQASFPSAFFMTRKDIECRVGFDMPEGSSLKEILGFVHDFSNLFALLTYSPAIPVDLKLCERVTDKPNLHIYQATYFERRTLESAQKGSYHWHMPIREPIVPLNKIIEEWFPIARDRSAIASTVQNRTGIRNENDIHAQIVLHATQLESIARDEGQITKKYEYSLTTYGGEHICDTLISIFEKTELHEIGVAISELRGEIAHVGRPKRWLTKLSISQVSAIEQCLQLAVIGKVLANIRVPADAICEYQFRYRPGS